MQILALLINFYMILLNFYMIEMNLIRVNYCIEFLK